MAESKSSDTAKYLVDIDFSEENGDPIRFQTKEEFNLWHNKEITFWSWLWTSQAKIVPSNINHFIHCLKVSVPFSTMQKGIEDWLRFSRGSTINGQNVQTPYFHSGSKKAQIIEEVKNLYGESAGIGALIFALGANFPIQNASLPISFFIGAMQYSLIYGGISPQTPQMAVEALDGVRSRAQQKFDELEQKSQALISSLEEKGEGVDRTRDVLKRYAPSRWNAFKAKSKKDVDDAIQELHNTNKLFREQMKIEAPVKYWDDKKEKHLDGKKKYFLWLAGFAPLSLSFTVVLILGFPALMMWIGYPQDVWHYIAIPLLLVWTTTIFWAGRVLVRLFLSEHHLAGDAEERAVMAQTYLALVNEDKADKEDRHIVLETLFRHSTDGIVKDDAAPNFFPSQLPPK